MAYLWLLCLSYHKNQKHVFNHPVHASFPLFEAIFFLSCSFSNEMCRDKRIRGSFQSGCWCERRTDSHNPLPLLYERALWTIVSLWNASGLVHISSRRIHMHLLEAAWSPCLVIQCETPLCHLSSSRLGPLTSSIHPSLAANLKLGVHADTAFLCFHKIRPLSSFRRRTFCAFPLVPGRGMP